MGLAKEIMLTLAPEEAFNKEFIDTYLQETAVREGFRHYTIVRRSIDARKGVKVHLKVMLTNEPEHKGWSPDFPAMDERKRVIIVGFGPAGMFAALRCLENGYKPIILERGKDVQARRIDIANVNKKSLVNEDSNYCFGEGGAGTYSDGKLYTRSGKRGSVREILDILHFHGARDEILFDAHPHIGTNKLPRIVKAIRETIVEGGAELHFDTRVVDFLIERDRIEGIKTQDGEIIKGGALVLATGHSARDVFELIQGRGILLERKPFALGVRVEHPQSLIDSIQYKCGPDRGEFLPASSYSLTHNISIRGKKRGIFSFCMCPGGFIVPASTSPGEIVVNGMSPSNRNSKYANSGMVVSVLDSDLTAYDQQGALAGMYWQGSIERQAVREGLGLAAPAQRLTDFIGGKTSSSLPSTSYQPGLYTAEFRDLLPPEIHRSLLQGFKAFGRQMKGYLTDEAQLVGIESRTSSPVRIPRDPGSFRHLQIQNLYPVGEGAGYAGGIVSAAMDGRNCIDHIEF